MVVSWLLLFCHGIPPSFYFKGVVFSIFSSDGFIIINMECVHIMAAVLKE